MVGYANNTYRMKIQHLMIILNQTLAFKLFCIIGKYYFFNECFFFWKCEIHDTKYFFSNNFSFVYLQGALPRLGLMALACSDGLIRILR